MVQTSGHSRNGRDDLPRLNDSIAKMNSCCLWTSPGHAIRSQRVLVIKAVRPVFKVITGAIAAIAFAAFVFGVIFPWVINSWANNERAKLKQEQAARAAPAR